MLLSGGNMRLSLKQYQPWSRILDHQRVKKLADSGLWRIRVRKCRIIYAIDDEAKIVTVVRVAKRGEGTYERL